MSESPNRIHRALTSENCRSNVDLKNKISVAWTAWIGGVPSQVHRMILPARLPMRSPPRFLRVAQP
eukprot:1177025-Rhodomonas_salina.1